MMVEKQQAKNVYIYSLIDKIRRMKKRTVERPTNSCLDVKTLHNKQESVKEYTEL